MNFLSKKQQQTIECIEEYLDIKFTGKTKKEAWEFINKYYNESRRAMRDQYFTIELDKAYKKEFNCKPPYPIIQPFDRTYYVLLFACGNYNKVICEKAVGEVRLDKGHPRFFWKTHAKQPCIGLEHWNKTLFENESDAVAQMNKLNEQGMQPLEWEAWVYEMNSKKNWISVKDALKLCKERI